MNGAVGRNIKFYLGCGRHMGICADWVNRIELKFYGWLVGEGK